MPETFKRESKYGLTVLTTTDEGLLRYLHNVQKQVAAWLTAGLIQRLVVVVQGADTMETLERWQFNVTVEESQSTTSKTNVENEGAGNNNNSQKDYRLAGDP